MTVDESVVRTGSVERSSPAAKGGTMSRFFTVLAVVAVSVIAVPTVSADTTDVAFHTAVGEQLGWDAEFAQLSPASTPGAGHDVAVGSLKVVSEIPGGGFQHVRVSAHSGPAGEDPEGSVHVTFDSPLLFGGNAGDVRGDVVCLNVTGAIAVVAAALRQPFMGNSHVTLVIFDIGNPGPTMGESPDGAFIGFTSAPPPTCATFGTSLVGDASGNLVVRDAVTS
jgi:hypothetical protein